VLDIPESDIMLALKFVVTHHRNIGSSNEDTMQFDSDRVIPALPSFLSSCVTYATSPAALRLAIHEHLPEGEGIVCVLEVIEDWISRLVSSGDALLPTKKASMHTDGSKALPPLTKVNTQFPILTLILKVFLLISRYSLSYKHYSTRPCSVYYNTSRLMGFSGKFCQKSS
jgi:hypothetical protein